MNLLQRSLFGVLLLSGMTASAQDPRPAATAFRADFEEFWTTVRDEYAYWHLRSTDWDSVRRRYTRMLDTIQGKAQFVGLLEGALGELYDHHAGLNTNTAASYRLVPTGSDLFAEYEKGRVLIRAVRPGTGAARSGIRAGMELVTVNGVPVGEAVAQVYPRCVPQGDSTARAYALQLVLAGTHDRPRRLGLRTQGPVQLFEPDRNGSMDDYRDEGLLQARILEGNIGYIRIANSLGDDALIAAFDSVLQQLAGTRGLVLDLRETPSGGNTTVARALMSRFITKESAYQRHELPSEERRYGVRRRWVELVSPRGKPYRKPLVILAGRWTGSMGEGITIGLEGFGRARVVGSRMAGLCGAIYSYRLPRTGIGFNIPAERLYHTDGTPRERFARIIPAADPDATGSTAVEAARQLLLKASR
ncbi:MAG: peptidase [Chitinophagaceae bacterium]|nr:MAG: peptidase [Chitinophagaceae bacterium]